MPNVSLCAQENEVHYNPKTWADEFFTIESLEDNNIIYIHGQQGFQAPPTFTLKVSTDCGNTWLTYSSSTNGNGTALAELNTGDKLLIKGNFYYSNFTGAYVHFISTKKFEIKGNIMSLSNGDSFKTAKTISSYVFERLFVGCNGLISAENLIMPVVTLASYCYERMFYGCTSLTTAPELPATTLTNYCYSYMFDGCTNLNSITCLATNISASNCTSNWVSGVAASGTFTKAASMSSWTTGAYGIPNGWTVKDKQ